MYWFKEKISENSAPSISKTLIPVTWCYH